MYKRVTEAIGKKIPMTEAKAIATMRDAVLHKFTHRERGRKKKKKEHKAHIVRTSTLLIQKRRYDMVVTKPAASSMAEGGVDRVLETGSASNCNCLCDELVHFTAS